MNRDFSGFRHGRGQVASGHGTQKTLPFMGSIAERDVPGMATAAETDRRPARETEGLAFLIDNLKIAFHANGAIVDNRNFCSGQVSLQKMLC